MNPELMQPKYRAIWDRTWREYADAHRVPKGAPVDSYLNAAEIADRYAANAVWTAALDEIVAARVYEVSPQ